MSFVFSRPQSVFAWTASQLNLFCMSVQVCAGFPLGAPKQKLYAARIKNWKAHFITKSGFGLDPPVVHDPPLVFNVDADPAEQYPVAADAIPAGVLDSIMSACHEFEEQLVWCVCVGILLLIVPDCTCRKLTRSARGCDNETARSRAMNAREDPIWWPCCTSYPRPSPSGHASNGSVMPPPPAHCRCP